jgi:hypothetical protein
MKLAVSALLIASVAGFSDMSMTFSLSKKPAAAPAPKAAAPKVVAAPAPKKVVVAAPKKAVVAAPKKVVVAPKVVAKKVIVASPAKKIVVVPKLASAQLKKFSPEAVKAAKTARAAFYEAYYAGGLPSKALPWTVAPKSLDGSMVGDVGFDPFGYSIPKSAGPPKRSGGIGSEVSQLNWLREAELMHGRIAQLAVVGFIWPALFGTIPSNDIIGADVYSYTNPLEAFGKVPPFALVQIVLFMGWLENRRVKIIKEEGANYIPGDQRIGQTGYNPFGLNYTPAEYEEKRLQELKHCRLAMVGILGLYLQASASGVSVVDQLSAGLSIPDYAARAGYFLPEGI